MYETYTRYILTAWFSGRRNASLSLPISLSTTIFLLYFSCSTQPVRSNHLRGKVTRENLPPPPPPLRNFAPARFLLRSTKKKRLYFFQRKFLLSKLYFNSSFYDSLRMKHHMCSISRLFEGKREESRSEEIISLCDVILIVNHHFHSYSTYSTYILI